MVSEKAQAPIGNIDMEDVFPTLVKKEKPRTSIEPAQALEILATAVAMCQQSGIEIGFSPFFEKGHTGTVIVLVNVKLVDGHLTKG